MMNYGIPLFLEDKSGHINGSEFVDLNDRMRLSYRCTAHDASHTAFIISNISRNLSYPTPLVALDFGPNHSLGTISFASGNSIPMKNWLVKVGGFGSSRARKFRASDQQEYTWFWKTQENQWTCTNNSGYLAAYYSLKIPGEPQYEGSSGCTLTVEEAFMGLASEMLASLMIMRHITHYNL